METTELKINYSDNYHCYWNTEGKNAKYLQACWDVFVPSSGESKNRYGELTRAYSRIVYDVYNNGGGNMSGSTNQDWGDMYYDFMHLIKRELYANNIPLDNFKSVRTLAPKHRFNQLWSKKRFTKALCHLGDEVVFILQKNLG